MLNTRMRFFLARITFAVLLVLCASCTIAYPTDEQLIAKKAVCEQHGLIAIPEFFGRSPRIAGYRCGVARK